MRKLFIAVMLLIPTAAFSQDWSGTYRPADNQLPVSAGNIEIKISTTQPKISAVVHFVGMSQGQMWDNNFNLSGVKNGSYLIMNSTDDGNNEPMILKFTDEKYYMDYMNKWILLIKE